MIVTSGVSSRYYYDWQKKRPTAALFYVPSEKKKSQQRNWRCKKGRFNNQTVQTSFNRI